MSVIAMFRVTGRSEESNITRKEGEPPEQVNVTLQPIYDEGSNKSWSKWTPSGELRMTITNPAAFEQIQRGKTFRVELVEVDPVTLEPK